MYRSVALIFRDNNYSIDAIFGNKYFAFFLLTGCSSLLCGLVVLLATLFVVLLGARARQVIDQLNFFHFQNVHEGHSCHICIVSSLMVVQKFGLAFIVCALILLVESAAQVVFKFVITRALFIDFAQPSSEERL